MTATDAQRIAYTLRRLRRWESNYRANAELRRASGQHAERIRLTTQADTIADIVKMLDGTEDAHVLSLGPICRDCGAMLNTEAGRLVDIASGDDGGTYDHCPASPDKLHHAAV